MKYIIGNWKANKNVTEAQQWIDSFLQLDLSRIKPSVQAILCPPYPLISLVKEKLKNVSFLHIGCQDTSIYYQGAYTGEVTAHTLSGLVEYAIIGHSERREHFRETDSMLFDKVKHLQQVGIKPIYCIRGIDDKVPQGAQYIAYEPVWAIGSGSAESIENILHLKSQLHLQPDVAFIYGGSVTEENAFHFLENNEIDGVLPGGASLDPKRFYEIMLTCP